MMYFEALNFAARLLRNLGGVPGAARRSDDEIISWAFCYLQEFEDHLTWLCENKITPEEFAMAVTRILHARRDVVRNAHE